MDQATTIEAPIATTTEALTTRIDDALRQFTARDLVAGAEVVDFLLDLRLILLSAEHPAEAASN
jgi:hypothetical protein